MAIAHQLQDNIAFNVKGNVQRICEGGDARVWHSLCRNCLFLFSFRVRGAAIRTRMLSVDFPCSLYPDVCIKARCGSLNRSAARRTSCPFIKLCVKERGGWEAALVQVWVERALYVLYISANYVNTLVVQLNCHPVSVYPKSTVQHLVRHGN